jgi:hypothetical protein
MEDTRCYYTGSITDSFCNIDRYNLYFDTASLKGQFQPQQVILSESTTEIQN